MKKLKKLIGISIAADAADPSNNTNTDECVDTSCYSPMCVDFSDSIEVHVFDMWGRMNFILHGYCRFPWIVFLNLVTYYYRCCGELDTKQVAYVQWKPMHQSHRKLEY